MRHLASFLILLLVCSGASAERPGLAFLRLSPDPRGGVLEGGMVATATDATALRYNPALLTSVSGLNVFVSHHQWVQDIRQQFAAVGLGGRTHHLGVGFGYVDYGAIDYRETATSDPLGTFHPSDLEALVGYGLRITDDLSVGVTARFLHEKILEDEATGFCADLGAWKSWPSFGLQAGVVVQHLGTMGELGSDSPRLPLTCRAAAAWSAPLGASGLLIGAQASTTPGIGTGAGLFAEYTYRRLLVLRSGLVGGDVASNWTVGTGMDLGRGSLDYTYVPVTNDLGTSHRFSISVWP